MQISLSTKVFDKKPTNSSEYNDISFVTHDITNSQEVIMQYFTNGNAISGIYKDNYFNRENHYMRDNYVGSDFLIVDVDNDDYNGYNWINTLNPKPTLWTTTFSANEHNCHCHIVYVLNETLYGSDAYSTLWNDITSGYPFQADRNARSPKRLFFTTNPSLPFFKCGWIGGTLDVTAYKDIKAIEKVHAQREYTQKEQSEVKIDEGFLADFNSMDRKDFLNKYVGVIKFNRKMQVDFKGKFYVDMKGKDYYQLNDKVIKVDGVARKRIIRKGERDRSIFHDARQLLSVNKNMTIEELLYAVVMEIDYFYDNSDGELTNDYIVTRLANIYNDFHEGKVWGTKTKRMLMVNNELYKEYYPQMKPIERVNDCRKTITDERIKALLNASRTIEENLKLFKENDLDIKRKRFIEFLDKYNITLDTNMDRIKRLLTKEGEGLSLREKVKLCKEHGYSVGINTIRDLERESVSEKELRININKKTEENNNIARTGNQDTPIDIFNLYNLMGAPIKHSSIGVERDS